MKLLVDWLNIELNIIRGIGSFILELLGEGGVNTKDEVIQLFTRREMMDAEFGENRLTSKGEMATSVMLQATERSFQKSRKPGTIKRRRKMMQDAFGDLALKFLEELLKDDMEMLKKDDVKVSEAINAEFIKTFEFGHYHQRCEQKAPFLWKLIRNLCAKDDTAGSGIGARKSRDLCAVLAVSYLLHARSENTNSMPKILGLLMAALHVPKRAISLLGWLGVTISYSQINRMMKDCAADCLSEVVKRVVESEDPFGVVYDNLVFSKRVSGETVLNR